MRTLILTAFVVVALSLFGGRASAHYQCPTDIGYGNIVDTCKHTHKPMDSPRSLDKSPEKVYTLHYWYFCFYPFEEGEEYRYCTEIDDVTIKTTIPNMMKEIRRVMTARCEGKPYTYRKRKLYIKRLFSKLCKDVPFWYYLE